MVMPKTAMDKDDDIVLRENDVRSARQIIAVKSESIAHLPESTSYDALRFSIA
jgi:hypothetical protein